MEFLFNDGLKESMVTRGSTEVGRLSELGAIGFGPGITDKNVVRTPHYDIDESLKMLELNVIVSSAVNQLVSFVMPNKTIKVASKDEATVEWLELWHEQRKGFMEELKNILTTRIVCGNAFMETLFLEKEGKGKHLDNIFSFNDSSRIYVNPDADEGALDKYVLRLPVGIKNFIYRGVEKKVSWYEVKYIKNYQYTMQRVYGCLLSDDELKHYKAGWCLPFSSKIETENGLMRIGNIVKNKVKIKVKTYNIKKKIFEFKEIVDWLKRPYKNKLYKIFYSDSKNKALICTEEHPVLTDKGFKQAKYLTKDDKVAVKTDTLTCSQKALIYGTLLGDASISKPVTRKHPRLSVSHCAAQKYYLDWIESSLNVLEPNVIKRYRHALNCGDTLYESFLLGTKQSGALTTIYKNCIV
jgi:hypothetical protein